MKTKRSVGGLARVFKISVTAFLNIAGVGGMAGDCAPHLWYRAVFGSTARFVGDGAVCFLPI